MNRQMTKSPSILMLMRVLVAISIFSMTDVDAQSTEPAITVEQSGQGEWNIFRDGEFVGTMKSDTLRSFTFFDTNGVFMGTIPESKVWFHRLYRKRNTQITPEEARLYRDALKAIEIIKK